MKRVVRSLRAVTPRGFTLPEVLVTVAIIAVLASAVVPTVVNQLSKGDTPALQADLNSIRQAITSFTSDVRAYPSKMSDLNRSSVLSSDAALCGTTYGTGASSFKGPYLQSKVDLSTSTFKTASYNLEILDALDTAGGQIAVSVKAADGAALDSATVSKLKLALDGVGGNYNQASGTANGNSGLVRFTASGTNLYNTDPVHILLVPYGKC